jgi:hypothetical protein
MESYLSDVIAKLPQAQRANADIHRVARNEAIAKRTAAFVAWKTANPERCAVISKRSKVKRAKLIRDAGFVRPGCRSCASVARIAAGTWSGDGTDRRAEGRRGLPAAWALSGGQADPTPLPAPVERLRPPFPTRTPKFHWAVLVESRRNTNLVLKRPGLGKRC